MIKEPISIENILEQIEKGERLGISEALQFLEASKKFLGKNELATFFNASKAQAKRHHGLQSLNCSIVSVIGKSNELIKNEIQTTASDLIYLDFSESDSFESILKTIEIASDYKIISALTPQLLFNISSLSKKKITDTIKELSYAGLTYFCGCIDSKSDFVEGLDEHFSVMMQCSKFKIQSSAYIPMSISDESKVYELAKLREFEDRTHAISHAVIYLDSKVNEKDLLRTVALCRLMLDSIETISLSDYNLNQSELISAEIRNELVELGVNQI